MREKKLILNTVTSLLLQLITIICDFILPRLILNHFGLDTNGHPNSENRIQKPEPFEEMISLIEKISNNIPHVRVDLYTLNDKVLFGEMTFFIGLGLCHLILKSRIRYLVMKYNYQILNNMIR